MKRLPPPALVLLVMAAIAAGACESWFGSSTPTLPAGQFFQVACLDTNHDGSVNGGDAPGISEPSVAAAGGGVDIALKPDAPPADCSSGGAEPELQLNEPTQAPQIDCQAAEPPLLLVGVGGGVVNLRDKSNAAGVRVMLAATQSALSDRGVQSQALAAGPGSPQAVEPNSSIEQLVTAFIASYLDTNPCVRVVLVGHSHGGTTATAVASALEGRGYGPRILVSVLVDRITALYSGDVTSAPQESPVFNIFQMNEPLRGDLVDQVNYENWDASAEKDEDNKPITHTTVDNSTSVRERIVSEVLERYATPASG